MKTITLNIPKEEFEQMGVSLVDAIVKSNLSPSKTQARHAIETGAIRINDEKIVDVNARLATLNGERVVIILGKENGSV